MGILDRALRGKKAKPKKAFWEDYVNDNPPKKERKPVSKTEIPVGTRQDNKGRVKKATKVQDKKKKKGRTIKAKGKDIKVEDKKDRSVEEVKAEIMGKDRVIVGMETLKEIISNLIELQLEEGATSRGQVPVDTEFKVLQRSQSSVEIKRDAKENIVFTIKAYADTSFEAAKEAIENFNKVQERVDG